LKRGDFILEVDGAPIGVIGGRTYQEWQQYKYSSDNVVEFLICFYNSAGELRYYYPEISLKKRELPN